MSNSLSLIVPVRNCEATLARQVVRWLEIVPELTQRFEVLIVDDASVDHTFDVAEDLARQYPQVRALRNAVFRGTQQAAKKGVEEARGDVVFVQDENADLSGNDLHRLWEIRQDQRQSTPRLPAKVKNLSGGLLDRLTTWGETLKTQGDQARQPAAAAMGRRGAMENLKAGPLNTEIKLSPVSTAEGCSQGEAMAAKSRTDSVHKGGMTRRGNGFLSHLRELALGE